MTTPKYKERSEISDQSLPNNPGRQASAKMPPRSTKGQRKLVIALSIYAGLRILVFAAAFPLFNNVDERLHLMSIQMYAQGHLPGKKLPLMDPELAKAFLPYWSPEYGHPQEELDRSGISGPPDRLQAQASGFTQRLYAQKLGEWLHKPNFEAQAAPLYYLVAGGWYNLGTAVGLRDWALLYWLRFLNAILFALFAWLSSMLVRKVYPENTFLSLSVPALIAVFPQDVFFGMSRDVLSPVMWAATLLFMVDAVADNKIQYRSALMASFMVGLTFLVEVSNCVLYGALAITLWMWASRSQAPRRHKVWVVSASAAAAFLAPFLWMLRNYLVIGDLTGSSAKIRVLGWTVLPLAEVLHHPLFTWHGLSYFLVKLTENFWHGEYGWHAMPMRSAGADLFYVISSALMILIFAIDFLGRRRSLPDAQSWAGLQSLFLVASSVLFLATISLAFDYHEHGYPSRLYPYFVSGRIISGALLPFVLIYASGLEVVTSRFHRWIPPVAVLACLMLLITISEIRVRSIVFSSHYNFFALSGWSRSLIHSPQDRDSWRPGTTSSCYRAR
jgi:hypothetical protein